VSPFIFTPSGTPVDTIKHLSKERNERRSNIFSAWGRIQREDSEAAGLIQSNPRRRKRVSLRRRRRLDPQARLAAADQARAIARKFAVTTATACGEHRAK
jgi:hypothetical protein